MALHELELVLDAALVHQQRQAAAVLQLGGRGVEHVLDAVVGVVGARGVAGVWALVVVVAAAQDAVLVGLHVAAHVGELVARIHLADVAAERTAQTAAVALEGAHPATGLVVGRAHVLDLAVVAQHRPGALVGVELEAVQHTVLALRHEAVVHGRVVQPGDGLVEDQRGAVPPAADHLRGDVSGQLLQLLVGGQAPALV